MAQAEKDHVFYLNKEKTDLLCAVVDPEDQQQRDEVENSKQVLAKADVLSMAGDVVESCEDVDKARRIPATAQRKLTPNGKITSSYGIKTWKSKEDTWHIHQGPSISFELRVVVGAIDDSLDFIHVGFPIYLRVCKIINNNPT